MPLLDTCFLIDVLRGSPGALGVLRMLQQGTRPLGTSPVCAYEVYAGVGRGKRPDGETQAAESLLAGLVTFPLSDQAARAAGLLEGALTKEGRQPSTLDLLIGCSAVHAGEPLVTRNAVDFRNIPGLEILAY